MRASDFDELIGLAEEVAGPGVGHGHRRRAGFVTKRTLQVTLPDGTRATRRTHHDYKLAVVCKHRSDEIYETLGISWGVFRWTTTVKLADRYRRTAEREQVYDDVRILPVTDTMDPKRGEA